MSPRCWPQLDALFGSPECLECRASPGPLLGTPRSACPTASAWACSPPGTWHARTPATRRGTTQPCSKSKSAGCLTEGPVGAEPPQPGAPGQSGQVERVRKPHWPVWKVSATIIKCSFCGRPCAAAIPALGTAQWRGETRERCPHAGGRGDRGDRSPSSLRRPHTQKLADPTPGRVSRKFRLLSPGRAGRGGQWARGRAGEQARAVLRGLRVAGRRRVGLWSAVTPRSGPR